MRLRKELLGIVLAFSTAGVIATNVDANAYENVYKQQDKQEKKTTQTLKSEFISEKDHEELTKNLDYFEQEKTRKTRRSLEAMIVSHDTELSRVKKQLIKQEAQVTKSELAELIKNVDTLDKKSKESFVIEGDLKQVEQVKSELTWLTSAKKVAPVRKLTKETDELNNQMNDHQTELVALVEHLKEDNKVAKDLSKKKYIPENEKKELEANQKENRNYFDDADNMVDVKSRKNDSESVLTKIKENQEKSEKDFKDYEGKSKELMKSSENLLSHGKLTDDERNKVSKNKETLSKKVAFKDYKPGDLETNYGYLQATYEEALKNSNQKIEDEKKQVEAAAKKAAQEAARAEQEAIKAAEQQAAAQANSNPTGTVSGGWYQAPSGYKYLKGASGKTYGQVKNPGNFSLITEAEAANYSPGHGNGSAKQ